MNAEDQRANRLKLQEDHIGRAIAESEQSGELRSAPSYGKPLHFGGSHAQRDLIDQTLLAAAAQGSRRAVGRALINERCMAKPVTPLTRFWIDKLTPPEEARA